MGERIKGREERMDGGTNVWLDAEGMSGRGDEWIFQENWIDREIDGEING